MQQLTIKNSSLWVYNEESVGERRLPLDNQAALLQFFELVNSIQMGRSLLPALDIRPIERTVWQHFYKFLVGLSQKRMVRLLQNMQSLNMLSFVQYRELCSCIMKGAELANLTLHDQEKLGNFVQF